MKKFLLCVSILIGLIILLFVINDGFNTKPFKFDKFKSSEEALKFFNQHYSIEEDSTRLILDLQKAGAQCVIVGKQDNINFKTRLPFDRMVSCNYNNGWISRDPLKRYVIAVFITKDNKLIEIHVSKHGWK